MKTLVLIALVFFLIQSCEKDKGNISLPTISDTTTYKSDLFKVNFIFVNHGDSTLKAVNLTSSLYRSHLNNYGFLAKSYTAVTTFDSIIHYSDSSKVNSRKKFQVNLNFIQNGVIVKKLDYWNTLDYDTIKKEEDGLEIFRWPEDTARYIKMWEWP